MQKISVSLFVLLAHCANPNLMTLQDSNPTQLSAVFQPTTTPTSVTQPTTASTGAALAPQIDPQMLSNLHGATSYGCSLSPPFERDSSVTYVLKHIEEAHPLLLDMLRNKKVSAPDRAFRILVIAGKAQSVPVMEEILLLNDELDSPSAGAYLGLHPSKEAFEVLFRALSSTQTHTLFGATLGLQERKDKAACEPLRKELTRKDDSQRYYVIQAALQLDCLTNKELKDISEQDSSTDIRERVKEGKRAR